MDDKELIDKCWAEYTSKFDLFGNEWQDMELDEIFKAGFEAARRSQPSIVLPEKGLNRYSDDVYAAEEIHERLTAAGIKYTIGE